MYSVAKATVTIGGSVQRIKKQGFAANIVMKDIWPLTVTETQVNIQKEKDATGANAKLLPIVYVSQIRDGV